ncbi:hypothetical protein LX32DRAFT_3133 [Colletotrichum zoysiae]|uniref:Uncharacterized protein n=1 Tax=Colletotrichum zoysiae TaxID=1216348 RepID=A0AAD9HWQ8_9PEZI|nr:hypothetical protein LX32DRAFT_3133 [Colletotrichum zoysiae]
MGGGADQSPAIRPGTWRQSRLVNGCMLCMRFISVRALNVVFFFLGDDSSCFVVPSAKRSFTPGGMQPPPPPHVCQASLHSMVMAMDWLVGHAPVVRFFGSPRRTVVVRGGVLSWQVSHGFPTLPSRSESVRRFRIADDQVGLAISLDGPDAACCGMAGVFVPSGKLRRCGSRPGPRKGSSWQVTPLLTVLALSAWPLRLPNQATQQL